MIISSEDFFRLKISESYKMHTVNLLDQLTPELIPFILKNLSIQDLKKCCSINNIWKDKVLRETRKRLIVDCTFIDAKVTVEALIDPKSRLNSISKALVRKMGLYLSREFGSKYPAVKSLGIGATNAGKKVMVRGWLYGEKISISIPDIFDLKSQSNTLPQCLGKSTEKFLVIDKPEYDVVLGETWLWRVRDRIEECINPKPKIYMYTPEWYNARNSVEKIITSLQIFYELIWPNFETYDTYDIDQNASIDLGEYCDSNYSETETETETESISSDSSYFSESDYMIVSSEEFAGPQNVRQNRLITRQVCATKNID